MSIIHLALNSRHLGVKALLLLWSIIWITACTPTPPRPLPPPPPDSQAGEIEALLSAGAYQDAAQIYLKQAERAQPPERERLQLNAAELLLRGQQVDQAEQLLAQLPLTGDASYTSQLGLLRAQLQLARQDPQAALQTLAPLANQVAPEFMPDLHRLRAQAYAQTGNHLESVRERVWLDGLLSPEERSANQQALWQSLNLLPDTVLATLPMAAPPDSFSGWVELLQLLRQHRADPEQLQAAMDEWRLRYPNHPAYPEFTENLLGRLADIGKQPGQIALLLPFNGQFQDAGIAVRDGIMAAYYQSDQRPQVRLRLYDTGLAGSQLMALYQRAVQDGAEWVIGPLTKEAVAELAQNSNLDVPVLALNVIDRPGQMPANLYQFSLSPDDEAGAVAERAWQDGHRRALVLIPEGSWGDRLLAAFEQRWLTLGGQLLEVQRYGNDQRSYSNIVRDLLKLDASERRYQSLTRLLGQRPDFEPRRRQDADFIFLVAYPQQGRLLRPLLRFHRASRLPVYSTSQIYSGQVDANLDRDMDGLRFCDMPWTLQTEHPDAALRAEIARLWPEREQRYTRLYAMGIDAFQLTRYLVGLGDGTFARHPGVTGDLYLDNQRLLHRDLQWSQFKNGVPTPLPPNHPLETEEFMDENPDAGSDNRVDNPARQELKDDYPVPTAPAGPAERGR